MSKRILVASFAAFTFFGAFNVPAALAAGPKSFLASVDKDNDGTVSLDEVKAYASARFQALETDKDGTLDAKELKGRLSARGFKAANADADKTIDEAEFLAYVEKLFKEANDNDDTLDAKELGTPAGRKLIKLLK
ncbi:MAG: EF-hand domain-containing protein [Beijerinckiaceae bacterium]|nr:EF-hand domain-containing protein [Beijerinckiaceae bacterium]